MITDAEATWIVTSEVSTPAIVAMLCFKFEASKKSLTSPLAISVSTTVCGEVEAGVWGAGGVRNSGDGSGTVKGGGNGSSTSCAGGCGRGGERGGGGDGNGGGGNGGGGSMRCGGGEGGGGDGNGGGGDGGNVSTSGVSGGEHGGCGGEGEGGGGEGGGARMNVTQEPASLPLDDGLMFFRSTVPGAVPSVDHIS